MMIDLHCHILFGMDDGSNDLHESIALARAAVNEGIRTIIATPHHKNGIYENTKQDIATKVKELNMVLQKEHIPLTILPGQETRIYGELLEDYHKGDIMTLADGDQYVFIELPSGHVPRYTERLLFDIQMAGLTPIIVHPERNQELIENPDILYQLVKKGSFTQVTAASIAGSFGKKIKKFSLQLIDANLAHFVASDAHNLSNRSFKMVDAYAEIERRFDGDMVFLFKENAELLVEGKAIFRDPPVRVKNKRIFGIF